MQFVNEQRRLGKLILGIGHRVKSVGLKLLKFTSFIIRLIIQINASKF